MSAKKCNFHTHCTFCDGKATAEEMVLSAIEKGFDVLGFSSHCMHPLNPDFYKPFDSVWHIPAENIKAYTQEIQRLKEKYAGKIKIYLGFEADYFESDKYGSAIPSKANYTEFNPDYLIGSVHFINTPGGYFTVDNKAEEVQKAIDMFYTDASGKVNGKALVCDYFNAERNMLKAGKFEIMGHPDLIRLRNGALNYFDENESWFKEELKLTAKAAASAGVIAEINTGAIARGLMNDIYPCKQFLDYLYECGVPVCINSDAHKAEFLDASFDFAAQCAKKAGYDELSYPVQGKIIHIKL